MHTTYSARKTGITAQSFIMPGLSGDTVATEGTTCGSLVVIDATIRNGLLKCLSNPENSE